MDTDFYQNNFRFGPDEYPRAVKTHQCVVCERDIEPGERYNRSRWFSRTDRQQGTWKSCRHCTALIFLGNYSFMDSTKMYTDVNMLRSWKDRALSISPKERKLKKLMRDQWRDVDNNLVPVPEFSKSPYRQAWSESLANHNLTIKDFYG